MQKLAIFLPNTKTTSIYPGQEYNSSVDVSWKGKQLSNGFNMCTCEVIAVVFAFLCFACIYENYACVEF